MYMRASTTGYFISLAHLFPTSEVLLSLIEALVHTASGSVFVGKKKKRKKKTFLACENGYVKSKKTQKSPD